jgi:hypothetical protein
MTERRLHRPLLVSASAALGVLVGGVCGVYGGFWLGLQGSDPPESESAFDATLEALERLVEAIPSIWLGALVGAILGWLVTPSLVGFVMKWPKVWLVLALQVLAGIALWLTAALIGSVLDFGAIGAWAFVVLMITGPSATGRWLIERRRPDTVPRDDGLQSSRDPE